MKAKDPKKFKISVSDPEENKHQDVWNQRKSLIRLGSCINQSLFNGDLIT